MGKRYLILSFKKKSAIIAVLLDASSMMIIKEYRRHLAFKDLKKKKLPTGYLLIKGKKNNNKKYSNFTVMKPGIHHLNHDQIVCHQ